MSTADQLWRDPSRTTDERVEALLAELTLAEKVAQLGSVWPGVESVTGEVAPMQDVFAANPDFEGSIGRGIGHLTRPFGTRPVTAAQGILRVRELQAAIVAASRLDIPAIVHEECLTGFNSYQATVYPGALAWAATFDPALVHEMATAIGADMAAVGVHQGLSPVLDVVRDYRWGRVEETLGEDPYLVSVLGGAYVSGLEHSGIIATLKHFAGYSGSRAARNHAPVSIGPREFAEQILPPFEYAVRIGGTRSVMNSYSDVDGVPAGADATLLTDLLRDTWGFTGTVVSDYWSVAFLKTMHRITDSWGGAGSAALTAGIDVELPNTLGFGEPLLAEVDAGRLDVGLVDRAVRRVLTQKVELGLLDPDWSLDGLDAAIELDSAGNRAIARRLAERSVVLLDNPTGLLPLADPKSIAVIGPCADDPQAFFGCYSYPNHVIPSFPEFGIGIEATSLLAAVRTEFAESVVTTAPGCLVVGGGLSDLTEAVELAGRADVVVLAVGDRAGLFGGGTSGEGCDVADLNLPGHQPALLEAILATGVPVVLVAVSGRPYALGLYQDRVAATVQAFFPGEEGGQALAGVLSGRINPSGKLPVEVPRQPGGQPHTYLAPPLAHHSAGVSNLDPTPAYPFGHGLSYATFTYRDLAASSADLSVDGVVELSVTVQNTSDRAGAEVVQLYVNDPVASVTRPVTALVGFARVDLQPGQSRLVTFSVHADRLSLIGRDLKRIVEPGEVRFRVGNSASSFTGEVSVQVVGAVRHVSGLRMMHTPVSIRTGER